MKLANISNKYHIKIFGKELKPGQELDLKGMRKKIDPRMTKESFKSFISRIIKDKELKLLED